ncbi:MAG: hypothetical protein ILO34_02670, partial [Kiritimatiellae bacterium]|nr:hypothetical protein [Kiritimatiellia bacterium]
MKKIMVFALCASCGAVFAADAVVDTVTGEPQVVSKATSTSYVFTSGGSITFSQSGTIDLLMVGGGGAGGTMIGAGGGAGEMKAISSYEVEAGVEYAVTIGAGGAPSGVQGMANWFQIGGNGGDTTFGELT